MSFVVTTDADNDGHTTKLQTVITSAEGCYDFTRICLSVCPLKSYEQILLKFLSSGGLDPRNGRLHCGSDPNHNPDPGIF